jgi:hypothetical protein
MRRRRRRGSVSQRASGSTSAKIGLDGWPRLQPSVEAQVAALAAAVQRIAAQVRGERVEPLDGARIAGGHRVHSRAWRSACEIDGAPTAGCNERGDGSTPR